MINQKDYKKIDITVFIIANLVNLLLVGLFFFRVSGFEQIAHTIGISITAMILPVGIIIILNIMGKREWWTIALLIPIILFFIVEIFFDYILKLDFRNNALLYPYSIIYYLGLIGILGYTFSIGRFFGFFTLFTYFLALFATWYAH